MKKLAFAALCIGSLGLFACGGGGGGVDATIDVCPDGECTGDETAANCPADCGDGDGGVPTDGPVAACNAIAGTGCASGEKCTWAEEVANPDLGRTDCVAAGAAAEGDACTYSDHADGNYDDCAAGLYCIGGVCTEICGQAENVNCDANEACVLISGLFTDTTNTGVCQPGCNPVAADPGCATDEGCFLNLSTGNSSCSGACANGDNPACNAGFTGATAVGENSCSSQWGTQHCNCEYTNACANGYGCILINDPVSATDLVCAYYCDTTGTPNAPTCPPSSVLSATSCRQVMTFYSDTPNVPAAIGMCIDSVAWDGYCGGCYDVNQPGCDIVACPP